MCPVMCDVVSYLGILLEQNKLPFSDNVSCMSFSDRSVPCYCVTQRPFFNLFFFLNKLYRSNKVAYSLVHSDEYIYILAD
jgi:hypothetical protein